VQSVLVIGAGLSGLAAARALSSQNVKVTILEARERPGGRVWTVDGLDLGAHWIHGTDGNPVTALAREFDIPTLFVGGDCSYTGGWDDIQFWRNGQLLPPEAKEASILAADELRDAMEELRRHREASGLGDLSLAEAAALISEAGSGRFEPGLDWHMAVVCRDDWAEAPESLSLREWDEGYEVYGPGDSVFLHGAGELVGRLAEGLDIRYGEAVQSISHDAGGVTVTTDKGSHSAAQAIVTLPLGVLKEGSVGFEPPLPEAKSAAIRRLGVGALTKIILRYEAPFWPREQYVFGNLARDIRHEPTTVINAWKTHRRPVLVMLMGGAEGRDMEGWTEQRLASWAKGVLDRMFGIDSPLPEGVQVTGWHRDPYSRGAYSHVPPGATPADIEALAEPVGGRLHFAGEHTARMHWAAMQGAVMSGLRAASQASGGRVAMPARRYTENRRWREQRLRSERFCSAVAARIPPAELAARVDLLRHSPVFELIGARDVELLAAMFARVRYGDGDEICRAGDPADCVFAVESGIVDVVPAGAGAPVATMGPGDVVGEYGMFVKHRTASLFARGSTSMLSLDYLHFRRFLMAFPASIMKMMETAVRRGEPATPPTLFLSPTQS
jgi:monoamine oxidase